MYTSKKPENENEYEKIVVDDKTFYKKKCKEEMSPSKSKRRYSDQFKDPLFKIKDDNRKLNMIKNFIEQHGNIEGLTNKYKEKIHECLCILEKDHQIEPSGIFKHFELEKYGFNPEDYGIEDIEVKEDEVCE